MHIIKCKKPVFFRNSIKLKPCAYSEDGHISLNSICRYQGKICANNFIDVENRYNATYFTIYETYITFNILTKSSFIFVAVHAVQPENTAVNKSAWTTTNDTTAPPNWAVDGNPATFTRILTPSWPFLAVDLGRDSTLKTVVLRLWNGECINVCIYIFIPNTYVSIYAYVYICTKITKKIC